MSKFVDQSDIGVASEHSVEIHLGKLDAAMLGESPRDYLERSQHPRRRGAVMGLDDRDDYVFALTEETCAFLEHRVGLTDTGSSTKQDSKSPPLHRSQPFSDASAMFRSTTLTRVSPR